MTLCCMGTHTGGTQDIFIVKEMETESHLITEIKWFACSLSKALWQFQFPSRKNQQVRLNLSKQEGAPCLHCGHRFRLLQLVGWECPAENSHTAGLGSCFLTLRVMRTCVRTYCTIHDTNLTSSLAPLSCLLSY